MLPYATPALHATVDPYEQTERDSLRAQVCRRLGPPAQVGARIALALCEGAKDHWELVELQW